MKELYKMELHDHLSVEIAGMPTGIIRVPGGWHYIYIGSRDSIVTFVPLNDEFKEKPKKENKPVSKDNSAKIIIDDLNARAGTRYKCISINRKMIESRMAEGYSRNDIECVVAYKCAQWMGTENQQYLRPATLFNREKFNQYYGQLGLKPTSAKDEFFDD